MLAGDVCLSEGANLISNGDFETFTNVDSQNILNSFATARFYDSESVSGWTVADGDGDGNQRVNLLTFDNARGTVLDVDSITNQDDRVFQDFAVTAGQDYLLTFDFFGPDQIADVDGPPTNNFEVFYNGELLGALEGVARFQTASFVIVGAANDPADSVSDGEEVLARLEFRDGSDGDRGGDGRGALIDAVSVVAITEQTVVNGDFESNSVPTGVSEFVPGEVDGFALFNFSEDAQRRVIELQNNGDGNFLNLNSSPQLIDQVFQDFDTEANQAYFITFDLRVDPASNLAPDELRVRFDNQFVANFVGNDQWQSYGVLVESTSETSRLTFREPGEDLGDGASPQIDNLRFFRVDDIATPVNDLVVDANGAAEGLRSEALFVANDGPQIIAPELVVSHESGSTLNLASIALVGAAPLATESLSVQVDPEIAAEYDPQAGILLLTGRASVADYQRVIRSLSYNNTGGNLVNRLVGISVTDSAIGEGTNFSPRTLIEVNVRQPPSLAAIDDLELSFGQAFSLNLATRAVGFDDATLTFEVAGAGTLSEQLTVSDANELVLPVATQAGSFDVAVAASDAQGGQAEQTFTVNVADFVPFEGIGALSNVPAQLRNDIYTEAPPQNIDTALTYDALLDTSQGEIRIRLLDDESPTFVNNFVNLARDGFYDGLNFHRVIDGFVAQGGDPLGTGTGGPGFEIPDEVGNEIEFDARGQLSFANAGNNTTGSQFFITFAPTGLNNNQFSVFGNVVAGDDVLDRLTRTQSPGSIPIPNVTPDVINSIRIEEV